MTTNTQQAPCPVCGQALDFRFARGRKSNKPSIILICRQDGRHFRGFITYQPYVKEVIDKLEDQEV